MNAYDGGEFSIATASSDSNTTETGDAPSVEEGLRSAAGKIASSGEPSANHRPWTQQGVCSAGTGVLVSTALCTPRSPQTPSGRTFYVATSGSDAWSGSSQQPFASLQRAVDVALPGDTVVLRAGVHRVAQSVRIVGKSGLATAPITLSGETGAILRASHSAVPGVWRGLIEIERAAHVIVRNIAVENSSFFGFRIRNSQNIELEGNRSRISLGSAIYAENSRDVVIIGNDVSRFCDKNQFGADGRTGCQEGISLTRVDGFAVYGNRVHDAMQSPGVTSGGGEGIDAKQGSRNGIIAFNTVWNLVQLGIYVDAYSDGVSNIDVYGNQVRRTNAGIVVSAEAGGTASDIRIHDNLIHSVGTDGILISNYASKSRAEGEGIRERIHIFNNTIADAGVREAKLSYFSPSASTNPASDYGSGIRIASARVGDVQILDNIVFGSKTSPIRVHQSAQLTTYVRTNLQWPPPSNRTNDEYPGIAPINADPLFVSAKDADWQLQTGSPAIGVGTGFSDSSRVDAAGNARPFGYVDLGALAFSSTPF